MEEEIFYKYMELEDQYENMHKGVERADLYPIEYGDVYKFSDRILLLEKAIRRKITLYDLQEMKILHKLRLEKELRENMNGSIRRK